MCGIVGAVAGRDVVPDPDRGTAAPRVPRLRLGGRRRAGRRGHDQAPAHGRQGAHAAGRARGRSRRSGLLGIAHTRWATHGVPSERNAHPHISRDGIAIVHNGIIENHEELRDELKRAGYEFTSETDTEVIAHRIHYHLQKTGDLFKAVRATVAELEGAYALAVISQDDPERIVARAPGLSGRDRPRRRRELRRLRRRGAAAGDAPLHVPRGRRRRRDPPRRASASSTATATPSQRPSARERAVGRRGREGRVPALHAEGDPRAAARRRADARGARRRRQAARGRVRPGGAGGVREDRGRAHRRLRHQLPRRAWSRATSSSRSAGCRAGSRSRASTATATRWCRRTRCSSASRSRARPPTRWPRCGSRSRRATCRSSRSATCRKARWCANPSS